ncbi:glycosyltransferase family 4 protein [Agriterribacter sp.]|uniref:glycosyltransferase family 4 protein n=1 Tax=Agriterribacter sp. TaxID=2821509 RepID=UPI002C09376B|nr:glycosyltransferase family 4 protein [Agriterribacter sp.]HTN05243.1 glycosyltransferase family 4 protein [Agriterribacter sp.]
MKILFLTPGCFDKGGISRYSRYQVTALRELFGEKNIRVLSLFGPEQDSFEEPFKVNWYAGSNVILQQIRFIGQTLWQIIKWRPNVIHIAHVNFSGFAHVLAKLFGIKTVLNVYGLEVWSGLSADAAYGLRKVNFVISDCHYTADYIEQENYRKKGSTAVIWDCVDLERFFPGMVNEKVRVKYGIPTRTDHFVVMSLGRLSKAAAHKGYDRLIKVFKLLSKKHDKARLVIAGKGDSREAYEEMVKHYDLSDKVIFTGMVDDKDLPDLYRCASVFSLVSDRGKGRGEGIPLTPLEAMACGIPVIVGNQDGSREAVIDNLNGSVIDPFDSEEHIRAFEALLCSPALLEEKSWSAADIAQTHFSYLNFKNKHEDFYSVLS